MSTTAIVIIVLLILGANAFFFWLLSQKLVSSKKPEESGLNLLSTQMEQLRQTMDSKLGESTKQVTDSLFRTNETSEKTIREVYSQLSKHLVDVTKGVTEANQATKQVFDIADQLQSLERVLKNQKQRGNLGEAGLELILNNMLPPTGYKLQYQFEGGDRVDAVIITPEGNIPIDAKFSLENYLRITQATDEGTIEVLKKEFRNDLKKRIDETSKYIKPKEGTLPFAFMYIPAEGIFYDLLVGEVGTLGVNTRSLIDYAYKEKHVIIVSPTTFAAYLNSVLYGFRAFKFQESVKGIIKNVEELTRHLKGYEQYHIRLGDNLKATVKSYTESGKQFKQIDKDVTKIGGASLELDIPVIEGPEKSGE